MASSTVPADHVIFRAIRRINVKCTKLAKIRPTSKAPHNYSLPAFLSNESSSAQPDGISSDFSQFCTF